MRVARILRAAIGLGVLLGLAAVRPASATSLTYELVSGQLTAVSVGFVDQTNRLAAPVDITAASVTVDFDPAVLDLNNLFIAAAGPGTVTLSGINGWDQVVFSNASLQSLGISDITAQGGGVFNFGTGAALTSNLALTNGAGTTQINGYTAQSAATGSILLTPDGLDVTLNGVVLGFLPDPVNPSLSEAVKADFHFTANSLSGSTAIPEPGSQLLFPAGLALLGWALRLKKA